MKISISLLISILPMWIAAQTIATFEEFDLAPESFLNGSNGATEFSSGDVILPVDYNDTYGSFIGWAISNQTDTTTPGFMNQYSAITGSGYDNSGNYAVTYAPDGAIIKLQTQAASVPVNGLYITNSTYGYLSMRDGDAFAKKFGGPTGDDPDFFRITFKPYRDGTLATDSIDFYLADYRFSDNDQDYIIDDWTWLDLSELGPADSLFCSLSSSDVGAFGMNTPAYFCVDHITTSLTTSVPENSEEPIIHFSPNPIRDILWLNTNLSSPFNVAIFNALGRPVINTRLSLDEQSFNMSELIPGTYYIKVTDGQGKLIKSVAILKL